MSDWRDRDVPLKTPLRDWMAVVAVIAFAAMFVAAIWIDFAPAPWLTGLGAFAAYGVLGLATTALIFRTGRRRGHGRFPGDARQWTGVLAMPLVLALLLMPVGSKLLPGVVTLAIGTPVAEVHAMRTESSYRKYKCDTRLTGGPLDSLFAGHLCLDEGTYARFPDQEIDVTLRGSRSVFGLWIDDYAVGAATD